MGVKTAFLNGKLEEEIFMQQPVGSMVEGQEQKACKLQKSIYGLKQSSRQWYLKISSYYEFIWLMRAVVFTSNKITICSFFLCGWHFVGIK